MGKIHLGGDGDLDIYTRLNSDLGDLSDGAGAGLQVNNTLVDAHLVGVPSLGTLTVGSLSGGDTQDLGGHSNGTLLDDLVLHGSGNDVGRNLLQLLDLGGGQGDSDLVDLFLLLFNLFLVSRHDDLFDVVGELQPIGSIL